mmetsp:Transcript_14697/g.41613  ORF Transcript_14697/g.41613 Transcript_14697/m.41613 type:complete len:229 (-) Transcript_14697:65-751(-)
MGGAFSSSSSNKTKQANKTKAAASVSQIDRATLDLKNSRDRLMKYKLKLEKDELKLIQRAKIAKQNGKTSTALQLLKIKKMKRNEVDSVEGQLLTVLQMVTTIDSKQNEGAVLNAMKAGKDALQKMQDQTTVDDVLELMDQISEQNEVEKEISAILGQGHETALSVDDEAAIEAELLALMGTPATTTTTTTALPEVPTDKPQTLPTAPDNKLPATASATASGKVAVAS